MAPRTNDEFREALRKLVPAFLGAGLFSGAINLLYLSSPLYLMQIFNRVLTSSSLPTLVMLIIALTVALLTMAALDALRMRVLVRAAMRFDRLLATRLLSAMVDRAAFVGHERGAQALRDFDQFRTIMAGPSIHFLFDAPWTPLYLGVLFLIHPLLGWLATMGAVLLLGLAILNDRLTRVLLEPAQNAVAESYAFSSSMVRDADTVRAMGMSEALTCRWLAARNRFLSKQARAGDVTGGVTAAIRFFRLLLQGLMLAAGAWLAVDHIILPATIFAASIIMSRALAPMEQAVTAWRHSGTAGQAAYRLRRLLHEHPRPAMRSMLPDPTGALTLEKVVYAPPASRRAILKGISFALAAGESLGVIGRSGAGKTTLARVVAGAVSPSAGHLKLGGYDVAHWRREDVGHYVGYLSDHASLFPGTVRDNIARFTDIADEEVLAAAKRAGIHDMVISLRDGYDTMLSEGGRELSGGQRQRIGLARAMLGSPRVVVLDEPNAYLDAAGERALDHAVADLQNAGVTLIVVSHRPNVLALVDKIIVLKDGAIEMIGPRDEVIEALRKRNLQPVTTGPSQIEARGA